MKRPEDLNQQLMKMSPEARSWVLSLSVQLAQTGRALSAACGNMTPEPWLRAEIWKWVGNEDDLSSDVVKAYFLAKASEVKDA